MAYLSSLTWRLVENREVKTETVYFEHDFAPEAFEDRLREAVGCYLMTPDGKGYNASIGNDFNWGDALVQISDGFWLLHGLRRQARGPGAHVDVEHDEVLSPLRGGGR